MEIKDIVVGKKYKVLTKDHGMSTNKGPALVSEISGGAIYYGYDFYSTGCSRSLEQFAASCEPWVEPVAGLSDVPKGQLPPVCIRCGGDKGGLNYMDASCWGAVRSTGEAHNMACAWDEGDRDFPRLGIAKDSGTIPPAQGAWVVGQRRKGPIAGVHCEVPVEYEVIKVDKDVSGGRVKCLTGCHEMLVVCSEKYVKASVLLSHPVIDDVVQAAPKAVLTRREVSVDGGKTWVDYERLNDSDSFEVYKHRRTITGGKVVDEVRVEAAANTNNRVIGQYGPVTKMTCQWQALRPVTSGFVRSTCGNPVSSARSPFCEEHVASVMRDRDAARPKPVQREESKSPVENRRFLDGAKRPWEF